MQMLLYRYLIELGMRAQIINICLNDKQFTFRLTRTITCLTIALLDYCETAIRLQKEWNMEDPQRLSFAPHVKSHALVSILNRGLIYNMHERRFAASQVSLKRILTHLNPQLTYATRNTMVHRPISQLLTRCLQLDSLAR